MTKERGTRTIFKRYVLISYATIIRSKWRAVAERGVTGLDGEVRQNREDTDGDIRRQIDRVRVTSSALNVDTLSRHDLGARVTGEPTNREEDAVVANEGQP